MRTDVEARVLRVAGKTFEHKGANISNVYTFKIMNKTMKDYDNLSFKVKKPAGAEVKMVGQDVITVKKENYSEGVLFIEIPQKDLDGYSTKVTIEVYDGDRLIQTTKTNFLGPRLLN